MLYEYRVYEAAPGRLGDLNRRFETLTLGVWARHGIEAVGFWTAEVGDSNTLYYLLRWADMAERERKWAAFLADEEWRAGRARTEENGPLTLKVHNAFWRPTSFSPLT